MNQPPNQLIFICTGNYYRSPLAQQLFNHHAQQTNLPWHAQSRGLLENNHLTGLSEDARHYLQQHNLQHLDNPQHTPTQLKVTDLETTPLLIALNQEEHQPMLHERFGQIPKILTQKNRLQYWNIYDVPGDTNTLTRLFGNRNTRPTQPPQSSTEHIHLAVRALIQDLQTKTTTNHQTTHKKTTP